MGKISIADEFLDSKISKKEFDKICKREMQNRDVSGYSLGIGLWEELYNREGKAIWNYAPDHQGRNSWKYEYLRYWEMLYLFETEGDNKARILEFTDELLRECQDPGCEYRKSMLKCWMTAAYMHTGNRKPELNPMAVLYDLMKENCHYDEHDCRVIVDDLIDRITRYTKNSDRQSELKNWIVNCLKNGDCAKLYQSKALSAVIQQGWDGESDKVGKKNKADQRWWLYWGAAIGMILALGLMIKTIGAGLSRFERPYSAPESIESDTVEETWHEVKRETETPAEPLEKMKLSTALERETKFSQGLAAFAGPGGETGPKGPEAEEENRTGLLSGETREGMEGTEERTEQRTEERTEERTEDGESAEIEWPVEVEYNPTKQAILSMESKYNLREEPDPKADATTQIPAGESVEIVARAGDWSRVVFIDKHGVKHEGYVKFVLP